MNATNNYLFKYITLWNYILFENQALHWGRPSGPSAAHAHLLFSTLGAPTQPTLSLFLHGPGRPWLCTTRHSATCGAEHFAEKVQLSSYN
jgi:hypothetical protein